MTNDERSIAHRFDGGHFLAREHPDGRVPWRPAEPPDVPAGRNTGRMRACSYCGSMHPADVAAAVRAGSKGHWADLKYGWPHKAYFDDVPNPHAGMLESRGWSSRPSQADIESGRWVEVPDPRAPRFDSKTGAPLPTKMQWILKPEPAAATTHGKFYSVHLQDATPEDRETIERHLWLAFTFDPDGKVHWQPLPAPPAKDE